MKNDSDMKRKNKKKTKMKEKEKNFSDENENWIVESNNFPLFEFMMKTKANSWFDVAMKTHAQLM